MLPGDAGIDLTPFRAAMRLRTNYLAIAQNGQSNIGYLYVYSAPTGTRIQKRCRPERRLNLGAQ